MNWAQYLLIFSFIILGFTNCNPKNFRYVSPQTSVDTINSIRIQDSITAVLNSQLKETYSAYRFGILVTNKPNEFIVLDSLYANRIALAKNKTKHGDNYPTLLANINQEIDSVKKEINTKKIYHSYEMDHIYTVKTEKGYTLHEDKFVFMPNFSLKELIPLMSTPLTTKEKVLFDYFSLSYPLFESGDYSYSQDMDDLVYERFNMALSLEKNNKAALMHTILFCVEYIRKNNSFDYEQIAIGQAEIRLTELFGADFVPVFAPIVELKNDDDLVGYSLTAINKIGKESVTFIVDLNLVITAVNLN